MRSALARPRNLAVNGAPDAPALAAAYAYGILRNHPFSDGNKRTGYALALVFLLDNGFAFTGSDVESVETMLAVADGSLGDDELAAWLRERVRSL
jgi:death-on-curing protein